MKDLLGAQRLLRAELRGRGVVIRAEAKDARFFKYRGKPIDFAREVLGFHLWSKQREILTAIVEHRRVAVHSCHDSGKSFILAVAVAYWLSVYPPGESFVVTTAPTFNQVRAILWREINRMHSLGHLPGRTTQIEWSIDNQLVAMGRKPSDYSPGAFQGIHALRVFVVIDEACAVAPTMWDAAETIITNDECRIVAIGNPDDPLTTFKTICDSSDWHTIHIDGLETPNFTNEDVPPAVKKVLLSRVWVEERQRGWGEDSPIYISKVRGRFPEQAEGGLISVKWILAAHARYEDAKAEPGLPIMGVDVGGGTGKGKTVAYLREGVRCRKIWEDNWNNTMKTASRVAMLQREYRAIVVNIDSNGIGKGVYDRLKQLGVPCLPVNVGEACDLDRDKKRFTNKRAHYYWDLRDRFENGLIDLDPSDDFVEAQLRAVQYEVRPNGKILIESKEDMLRRGLASPDHADALMLCCAPTRFAGAPAESTFGGLSLGTKRSAWLGGDEDDDDDEPREDLED